MRPSWLPLLCCAVHQAAAWTAPTRARAALAARAPRVATARARPPPAMSLGRSRERREAARARLKRRQPFQLSIGARRGGRAAFRDARLAIFPGSASTRRVDGSPRVARLVPADYPGRSRGVAATHIHGTIRGRPRRRDSSPRIYPRPSATRRDPRRRGLVTSLRVVLPAVIATAVGVEYYDNLSACRGRAELGETKPVFGRCSRRRTADVPARETRARTRSVSLAGTSTPTGSTRLLSDSSRRTRSSSSRRF